MWWGNTLIMIVKYGNIGQVIVSDLENKHSAPYMLFHWQLNWESKETKKE